MTDNDILKFAMMPKYSHSHAIQIQATEALVPVSSMVSELESAFEQISLFNRAHMKISRHGLTDYIKEEFGDTLSPYSINFESQTVSACLEGLSSMIERLWNVIKNTLTRLFEYVTNNTFLGELFDKCEYYQHRMSAIIAGPLRGYIKADVDAFNSSVISGLAYDQFVQYINYVGILISKLRSISSFSLDNVQVSSSMVDVARYLSIPYEDGKYRSIAPVVKRDSLYNLYWSPFKVYSVANQLYSKIAVNASNLRRLKGELTRALTVALAECNNVLSGRTDGTNEETIQKAKLRVNNIRNVQALTQTAISYLCIMCGQWCRMASLFDTGERPYPA